MEYKEYKLKDICKFQEGYVNPKQTKPEYFDGKIKWLRANDLQNNYVYNTSRTLTKEGFESAGKSAKLFKPDTIAISKSGTIGKLGILKDYMCGNRAVINIESNEKIVDIKYIYYFLLQNRKYIESLAQGSVQKNLYIFILENVKIKLPNKENQEKIIKILNDIDEKLELNNQINNNLQEIANAIFIKWFYDFDYPTIDNKPYRSSGGKMIESELGKIPEKWKVGLFQDIVEFSNGYGFKSSDLLDKEEKNTLKVFKQGNINLCGGINEEKTKSWIYKEKCIGLEKFVLKKGDILMCMTDMKNSTSPLLGHTALMNINDKYIVNQRVGLIRCKKEKTEYPYVYTMTNLEYFLKDIRSRANSGVQVNLSTKGICETKIIIPAKDIMDEYNDIAKPLYEIMFNNQKENQRLESLRDVILPKLLKGEIDIENVKI